MFSPEELLNWTFSQRRPIIVTTSFGNHAAVLLDMISMYKSVPIVWVDTQFNTSSTIAFKHELTKRFDIDVRTYIGRPWTREVPLIDTPEHDAFVEQVKLAPFRQAIAELQPEIWVTGIRREQTKHRNSLKCIEQVNGLTKVSPLLEWRTHNLEDYIETYRLPNESNYFDPTKVLEHRECGLHTHDFRLAV